MILSHITIFIIAFGHLKQNIVTPLLETSIDKCPNDTISQNFNSFNQEKYFPTNFSTIINQNEFPQNVFSISFMYYSFIGTFITVFVGTLISCVFRSKEDCYDRNLLHPVVSKICSKIPSTKCLFREQPV
jgi:hypothetical protein